MNAALLLVLLPTWAPQEWRALLDSEDYARAWSVAEALPDPILRARAEAEIRYRAGDPAGALAAAEAGLARAPDELELLFYASGSALWLQEAELARSHVGQLEAALAAAALDPEARNAWQRTAREHADQAAALTANETARNRAVRTARALASFYLGAALLALFWLGRPQGRSSSPVS